MQFLLFRKQFNFYVSTLKKAAAWGSFLLHIGGMSNTQNLCCILLAHNPASAPGFANVGYAQGNQVPYGNPQYAPGNFQGRLLCYRSAILLGHKHGEQEDSPEQPSLIYFSDINSVGFLVTSILLKVLLFSWCQCVLSSASSGSLKCWMFFLTGHQLEFVREVSLVQSN